MLPTPKRNRCGQVYHDLKTNRCGKAQYVDENGEKVYLCPKCFHPIEAKDKKKK